MFWMLSASVAKVAQLDQQADCSESCDSDRSHYSSVPWSRRRARVLTRKRKNEGFGISGEPAGADCRHRPLLKQAPYFAGGS